MTDDSKQTLDTLSQMTCLARQLLVLDMAQLAIKAAQEGQDYSAALKALADYAYVQGGEDLEQSTSELGKAVLKNLNRILKAHDGGSRDDGRSH